MTRRDFISTAAMATAGTVLASPTRSNVGGSMTSLIVKSAAPIDLPYVTDGLEAFWDGEWNAGYGEHRYDVTDWVDLSGKRRRFHADSPSWFDNYCEMNGTVADCFRCPSLADGQWLIDLLATGFYTTEFVCRRPNNYNPAFFTCGNNGGYAPGLYTRSSSVNLTTSGFHIWNKNGVQQDFNRSGIGAFDDKLCQICANGTSCVLGVHGTGNSVYGSLEGDMCVEIAVGGKPHYRFAFACDGSGAYVSTNHGTRLYRLAIYSRTLTQMELEFNASIDVERFGL